MLTLPGGPGLCYSGYRRGQTPAESIYPSVAEIREDLRLLAPRWSLLRLYDCSPHAERVLQVIREDRLPVRVLLGAHLAAEVSNPDCPWGGRYSAGQLAANRRANEAEVERLVALARANPEVVWALAVGNEATVAWTDHLVPVARVRELVRHAKARASQPVTVCENHVPWMRELDSLVPELDFLAVHSYPLWEGHQVATALACTQADVARVQARWPDVPVVLTEVGWATAANGRGFPSANASEAAQARHLTELVAWAKASGVLAFLFEAFDEPWKGDDHPLEPEKHWGLYDVDRRPKPVVAAIERLGAGGEPLA